MDILHNGKTLTFNAIIYVDCTLGNDTSGSGTSTSPYATLSKACTSVVQNNTCIYVVGAGTYNVTGLVDLLNLTYEISYIVKDSLSGQVVLNLNSSSVGTNSVPIMTKSNSFYGFILRRPTGADSRIFAYFFNGSTINLEFNNCLFDLINGYPTDYPIYTGNTSVGSTITKLKYNNCSFIPNFASNNSTGGFRGTFINCAFAKASFTTQSYNLCGTTFDSQYNITTGSWQNVGIGTNPDGTVANIGIYGGLFAWGKWSGEKYLINQNSKYYSIKSNFYELGAPVDNATLEAWYDKYGADDLNSITANLTSRDMPMTLDGATGIWKTDFQLDANLVQDSVEMLEVDADNKVIKHGSPTYRIYDDYLVDTFNINMLKKE